MKNSYLSAVENASQFLLDNYFRKTLARKNFNFLIWIVLFFATESCFHIQFIVPHYMIISMSEYRQSKSLYLLAHSLGF